MPKIKILTIGSAVIDLIFLGKIFTQRIKGDRLSLAYGGKYVVDNFYQFFGGGAANAAVSLSRQGINSNIWTRTSKDFFGSLIVKNLKKEKVGCSLIKKNLDHSPISTILLDTYGNRTIINYRSSADKLDFGNKSRSFIKKCDWIAMFSMPHWGKENKIEVLKFARENNIKVFLSLNGNEYRKGLNFVSNFFPYCTILDLNIYELADLLGTKAEKISLEKENFSRKFNIPIVLVTCDKRGSFLHSLDEVIYQPALPVKLADATGAGDAFSAGFLGKYVKTGNLKKSMEFAARNAKAEIEALGAQTGLLRDR